MELKQICILICSIFRLDTKHKVHTNIVECFLSELSNPQRVCKRARDAVLPRTSEASKLRTLNFPIIKKENKIN